MSTIFDKIVSGEMKSWKVWEDDDYLAFLTPFPNTPGFTVVIPKENVGDYLFNLEDKYYQGLLEASQKVAKKLEKAFNTPRVAMIVEGTGVPHAHTKLLPLLGSLENAADAAGEHEVFDNEYKGYITSAGGPKMDDTELDKIHKMIQDA